MKNSYFLLIPILTFCTPSLAQTTKIVNSKRAIICLTYDDCLETQLSTAIPQLDSVGLKATFFINSIKGSSSSEVIGQTPEAVISWHNVALNGHELANHTMFHPCPEKLGWLKAVSIDNYTVERIVQEITIENVMLTLLDNKSVNRAFAFPCNNTFIRDTDYAQIIKNKGLVKFGRTGGDRNSIITDFKNLNTMQVPSWLVEEGASLNELIEFAEKVKKNGGMGIYQFHGIGGQIFKISKETHKTFLEYLKQNQAGFWITTFSEAMEFISAK